MGKCQGKSTFNTINDNASPSEPTGPSIARPEYPYTDEQKKNDIKITLRRLYRPWKMEKFP